MRRSFLTERTEIDWRWVRWGGYKEGYLGFWGLMMGWDVWEDVELEVEAEGEDLISIEDTSIALCREKYF